MAPGACSVLAAAFASSLRRDGLTAPPGLRLLAGMREPEVGGSPVAGPEDLGPLHETLACEPERTRRGAWYTPRWLADDLVGRALPDQAAAALGPVVDPACGGGVFLLAAVERLVALGSAPAAAVAHVRGNDLDPLAVAVTEAALWWWGARLGAAVRPAVTVADALLGPMVDQPGTVVGNPPFLGQLRAATAVDDARRAALRDRFGSAVAPYTDPAWLFLLDAVERVADGGRVVLVQPQSLLGARDAGVVRRSIDDVAALEDVVVDDGRAFRAGVDVCAPVLRRTAAAAHNDWLAALVSARGIPGVRLSGARRLGDVATVHAGFRDEFYGLVDAVAEGGDGLRLVTVGAIDPCTHLSDRPVRFANRRWRDPRVDAAVLEGRSRRWAEVQSGPKLLVATQTRVLEALADPDGEMLGSVPVLCVRPREPDRLWHLLAALHAPAISAWVVRRTIGTALSADACKPTAAVLGDLPLPEDGLAWDRAAVLARRVSTGGAGLDELARAADAAYGVDDAGVHDWWARRRPHR